MKTLRARSKKVKGVHLIITQTLLILNPPINKIPRAEEEKKTQNNKTPRKKIGLRAKRARKIWTFFGRYQGENGQKRVFFARRAIVFK